ncbi:MAG: YCF48-related protein [candidate division KSB1 bacterium]|nr:YCF48-related protein [candidate division KSB1 bacterium]
MRKCLTMLVIIVVWVTISFAQTTEQWFWQNPKPQGNPLHDIWLFDSQTAIAVGDVGTVITTSNGGQNWSVAHYCGGSSSNLLAVFFVNRNTGWAGGTNGSILKTTDGGNTWSAQTIPDVAEIRGLYFHDSLNGWAVGYKIKSNEKIGVILNTADGGQNWTVVENAHASVLNAVQFGNQNLGWAVGSKYVVAPQNPEDIILKTDDGGHTWTPIYTRLTKELFSISFIDAMQGWAVGDGINTPGIILYTADGGLTWNQRSQTSPTIPLWSIAFKDANVGCAVGKDGAVYRTDDGGITWKAGITDVLRNLNAVRFTNTNIVMAVGNAGVIIRSEDNGSVWQENSTGTAAWNFYGVNFVDENTGWVVGPNKTILKSSDGGQNWAAQTTPSSETLYDIFFVDDHCGWAIGEWGLILHTIDGGSNWLPQDANTRFFLNACFFKDKDTGWICGGNVSADSSIILYTTNGGTNWSRQNCSVMATLHDIYFLNDKRGWVVGENGAVLNTENAGANWTFVATGRTEKFYSVFFINDTTGWIGGNSILKTTDGGKSWREQITYAEPDYIRKIYFLNPLVGWAVKQGLEGALLKTMDGGATWDKLDIGTANSLYDISIIDENMGWVVGTYSTILKSVGLIVPVELSLFDALWRNSRVELNWTTVSESNNYGFAIERQSPGSAIWQKIGFVPGHGTTMEPHHYNFTDHPIGNGTFGYRLKQIDANGAVQFSPTREVIVPARFVLYQNTPNPFNPETTIQFELAISSQVTLELYNLLGQKVATILDEQKSAGYHKIIWAGKDDWGRPLNSGVYFYRLKAGNFEATKKLVLIK